MLRRLEYVNRAEGSGLRVPKLRSLFIYLCIHTCIYIYIYVLALWVATRDQSVQRSIWAPGERGEDKRGEANCPCRDLHKASGVWFTWILQYPEALAFVLRSRKTGFPGKPLCPCWGLKDPTPAYTKGGAFFPELQRILPHRPCSR